MLRLDRVNVSGFRGFTHEQGLDFDTPLTLLFGENGTGKSSALNAIEWVLFGKDCVGTATGIRERVGWELANRDTSPQGANVTAQFSGEDGTIILSRSLSPGTGARLHEHVEVSLPDRSTLGEGEAEEWLAANIASSFRDFLTTVYQHQEVIRAVLTQEARDRNDALDRLLGLSDYRNMIAGIDGARIGKDFKQASGQKDDISKEVERALRLREDDLEELKDKALGSGLDASELTEEGGVERAAALAQAVRRFMDDSGLGELEADAPKSADGLSDFCESVRRTLGSARGQVPALSTEQELLERRAIIARLQQNLGGLRRDQEESKRLLGDYGRRYGSPEQLRERISELESKEATTQERLREANAKAPLLAEAIKYMESLGPEQLAGRCPVCGKQSPDLLRELQAEWEALVDAEIKALEDELENTRREKAALAEGASTWEQAEEKSDDIEERLDRFGNAVAGALKMEIGTGTDLGKLLKDELASVQQRLEAVEQNVNEKMRAIDALEQDLEKVKAIGEFLQGAEKVERLNEVWESPEFQEVEVAFGEAAQFYEDLEAIKEAVSEVAAEGATAKVTQASELVDKFFRETAAHPGLASVVLTVAADRYGRNSYTFVDEAGRDLLPILSQGDMNCLALSIFLALGSAAARQASFSFLLLDDPTQSLGSDEKRSLASLLRDLSKKKRLIVSTMDSELRSALLEVFPASDVTVYSFTSWDPANGPRIEKQEAK